jgi:hypothetical protein
MLYLLLTERKKRVKWLGAFFPEQTCPVDCAVLIFSWLLGAIKGCFKYQPLNIVSTQCVGNYYFG